MMNFGFEQYFIATLGIIFHWMVDLKNGWWVKPNREPFNLKKWWSHNSLPFIMNVFGSYTLIYLLKRYGEFNDVPIFYRDLMCMGIGYQGNELLKSLLKKTSERIIESISGQDKTSNNEL